ncbi:Immunity protein Imm1 [Streptoalloteichus tenebrarius]|uniref:Immunity protein Imm1 n=1 Tax=Streptoalloteichus tenebrarius (strain ATCC 17920 / DSM 40477 / JCM 4838 / CBS 697.72 / NBRC 16177 / NCIMB 11028 / NRRL B-12390 / A12253. 1 / ISP 5477) TaxID=1933 RepID=A0ABT1HLI1_STRSD|nr:Imm1 family immunity protein [Streptoalloteichus tenebrarius]MCP2256369.1 Immunity protein Imm1 [Streptoalloteichus tenebrarius]BFF04711.1 hypothetical protein GCM10020241_63860 [Streptoalloteichus tenebrarius]
MTTNYTAHIFAQACNGDIEGDARSDDHLGRLFDQILEAEVHGFWHNPSVYIVERPRFGVAEVPDHGLKFDLDVTAGVGALGYFGPDFDAPSMSLSTPPIPGAPVLYQDRHSALEFPANAAIPLAKVREAVLEFRRSGGRRPTCVEWQPADGW